MNKAWEDWDKFYCVFEKKERGKQCLLLEH